MDTFIRRILCDYGLFICILALRFGLSYWLLGGVYARVHDNLDSVVVYSAVAGEFWSSGFDTSVYDVFIGGASRWYHYTQTFSPLTALYALFQPGVAYMATELIGLIVAYWGMLRLLREVFSPRPAMQVLACLFAFSISFHSYGLGLSAAPIIVWLALRNAPLGPWAILGIFLIGLSTAFAFHGLFLPIVFVFVCLMLGMRPPLLQSAVVFGTFLLGSLLASGGILYATVFDPASHRTAWDPQHITPGVTEFLADLSADVLVLEGQYHAILLPGLFAAFFIAAGLAAKRWRGVFWSVAMVALASTLSLGLPFYAEVLPGPLATIQYTRLGQFGGLVLVVLAGLAMASEANRFSRALCWSGCALYGLVALTQSVGLNEETLIDTVPDDLRARGEEVLGNRDYARFFSSEFFGGEGISRQSMRLANQTFTSHFRPALYACYQDALPDGARVLSIGIDPMIAPLNGIAAIDGYHNFYPLSYKLQFGAVIARQIEPDAHLRQYFNGWGSRLNSFVEDPSAIRLDLEAARAVGATHIISRFDLETSVLSQQIAPIAPECTNDGGLTLYQLTGET